MCDSTLLLIKDKIINTDAIIKLLSDKNTQLNQLKRQAKFLYKTYLAQTKELEICKLKETTKELNLNEKSLLQKYTELETIHQDYVNVSAIKYQNICKELEEHKTSKSTTTTLKTIKKCINCKEALENNRSLKQKNTMLIQKIEKLSNTTELKNKEHIKEYKNSSHYREIKQRHTTEIENIMAEHMIQLDKVETKFKSEINEYQDRIVSLESRIVILKDKIDELKLDLHETKICLAEKNKTKSENQVNKEIKGGLYELLSECDLVVPKVDDRLKIKLDQSSQTDQISFYLNEMKHNKNVDAISLFGDNLSDVLNDHQEDFIEFNNVEDEKNDQEDFIEFNNLENEKNGVEPLGENIKALNKPNEDLNDYNIDVWKCIQEMKDIPEPLSALSSSENEEETPTPKKQTVFNKKVKLKRLAQEKRRRFIANVKKDLFTSLVKYVGKMLKKSNDKENKSNSNKLKKMSKQFKNKRKLEMLRWTALREISSTDSDVSCTSKSRIKMRKLEKYKHLKVNNKEEYAKFSAKFNTITEFYNSLSGNESKDDNVNNGEESCWSGQDSGFGRSENEEQINIQPIKILKDDKLKLGEMLKLASSKETPHNDLFDNKKSVFNNEDFREKNNNSLKKSAINNSNKKLLFDHSSSKYDSISSDTKELDATPKVSCDHVISVKELSQNKSFEIKNHEENNLVKEDLKVRNFETVPKIIENSENEEQVNGRRCSPRIKKLKHKESVKEIIERGKTVHTKSITNSILDLISIEASLEKSFPSHINNKNELFGGCSSSESDNELISDKKLTNPDEVSEMQLSNSKQQLSSVQVPSKINEGDVPVRAMKIRKANCVNQTVKNLKRKIDIPVKTTSKSEPSNKLKKVEDDVMKSFEKDDEVKEVIKVESDRKLERTSFKRPVKRKLNTPMSPPHSVECEFIPPKIIPLEAAGELHEGVGKKLLKKLIQFPDESVILQEIFDKFSSQKRNYIIRLIIDEVSIDTSKSDNKYTPPAPILTPVQRTLLGLTMKLQESFPDILPEMLFSLEHRILTEKSLNSLISITRFYTGICKLEKELHRMRRMIGDVFFILNDLAIPFFYTVLSTWTEILPLESESQDNMLVKVLIQITNMKSCKPGYCLTTLKGLLQNYYGYPKERWKSEDVFNEVFTKFKENPSKFLEFALLILLKNHPEKWSFEQMRVHLKPLLNDSGDNHVKEAIVVLISSALPQFGSDNCQYIQEIQTWLKNLNSTNTI